MTILNISTSFLVSMLLMLMSFCDAYGNGERQGKRTYIVHVDKSLMPASFEDHSHWYDATLKSVSASADMFYTYNNVIHGFSAALTADEAESLERQTGILMVLPDTKYELHTTRTPIFLGLVANEDVLPQSQAVVIGVVDTGFWPESKSFDDTGLGPVPGNWKGTCEVAKTFNSSSCNNKVIGATSYWKGYEAALGQIDETMESKSPRDDLGHGSHTASTAAGAAVPGANFLGYAPGTARGMASLARLAIYKVCWIGGCFSSDITAGMDKAVEDGVDVLSLSLGGPVTEFYRDNLAIGAFGATEKGIFVSCSAGNRGPSPQSLSNEAPWVTTVGAGHLDRQFPAYVSLGSGKNITGASLYSGSPLSGFVPLVYAANASNSSSGGALCLPGSGLIPEKVKGRIVVCERGGSRVQKGVTIKDAGGVGMILANNEAYGEELTSDAHLIPTVAVTLKSSDLIKDYVLSDGNPRAKLAFGGTQVGVRPSPLVAGFSSRGPSSLAPGILKPDILAPGFDILAAWSGTAAPTETKADTRRVSFNIISGTSMSSPHVGGLAAILKAAHPEWSPAKIRSALMTTAYTTDRSGETIMDATTLMPSTPFDCGAGHVDPIKALDPGLVYDIGIDDYLEFLCALKYSSSEIRAIAKRAFSCDSSKTYSEASLNYPSFAVPLQTGSGSGSGASVVKHTRTLTNVGTPATYKVSLMDVPKEVRVSVEPMALSFEQLNEEKNYTVTFTASSMPSGTTSFASLAWSDSKRVVRSQIAFTWS